MLDQSSVVSLVSAVISAGVVVVVMLTTNKVVMQHLKESILRIEVKLDTSVMTLKTDIKENIRDEKRHAMELADAKIAVIKKDVDDVQHQLRLVEAKL